MAVKRLIFGIFYAAVFLKCLCAQISGTGAISGTVIDSVSGDPVRKAIVTLTLEGTPRRWATARTDGSGVFEFQNLPAGKYDLRATKTDEGTAIYGATNLGELGDRIPLADGQRRTGLTLRFLHAASISGHVYDSDGDPIPDLSVQLLRRGRNRGAPTLVPYQGASTDDRGAYHLSNINPGHYYLRASPLSGPQFSGVTAEGHPMLVGEYFDGVRAAKDAAPIHVAGGDALEGFDFRLPAEPSVGLHGQIFGVPEDLQEQGRRTPDPITGNFEGGVSVSVSPAESDSQRWTTGTVTQGPDHRFNLGEVPSGSYRIDAELRRGTKTYGASQVFDIHPGSGDLQLTLAPGVEVQGTLRIEGTLPVKSNREEPSSETGSFSFISGRALIVNNGAPVRPDGRLQVQLVRPGGAGERFSAAAGADGHFSLGQVPPGEWELLVNPVPPGFLKTAQFGDKDVRFASFNVPADGDAPALNITISMHTASVEGDVGAGSSDNARAGIVLAPLGPWHGFTRFYYGATTDAEGKFHIDGVAPGKYKIFAIEKMPAAEFRNPEAADQLDSLGDTLNLDEGAKVEAHPKLIPAERAEKALQ